MKKIIIISAINFSEGGPLTIYKECLKYLEENSLKEYEIIALVHNKDLFSEFKSKIEFIEFKDSKKSYLKRMYYEYFCFKKLSKKLKPYLWFSLHDMTPNVVADKRVVYCHNPMMFYKMTKEERKKSFKLFLFSKFYKYVYKINIKKNNYVIVQQNWIREEFKKIFKIDNVIVAHPEVNLGDLKIDKSIEVEKNSFVYPSFPRVFKNFEVICEAVKILESKNIKNFKVYLTIDGSENVYSKKIVAKYSQLECIEFIGLQSRESLMEYYNKVETVIFPSKIETWGLPITEAKEFKKKLILADLPYAHETLGNYENVFFFNSSSPQELASKMESVIKEKNINFDGNVCEKIEQPYCNNWKELFEIILKK